MVVTSCSPSPFLTAAQWFSPLGSSATRIMPASESTPPPLNRSSNGSGSGSVQSHVRPGSSPPGNPFGAWPPEQVASAATTATAAGERAGSADSMSSAGSREAQHCAAVATPNTAQGNAIAPGAFWSTPAAQGAIFDMQAGETAAPSAQRLAVQQADEGTVGRKQGGVSSGWGSPGVPHKSATPAAKKASPWGHPGQRAAAMVEGKPRQASGQLPLPHSPLAHQQAADMHPALLDQNGPLRKYSKEEKHGTLQAELSALKKQVCSLKRVSPRAWLFIYLSWMVWMHALWGFWTGASSGDGTQMCLSSEQLEEERGSKCGLEHRLEEAARAEQALAAELRAMHLKLRCQNVCNRLLHNPLSLLSFQVASNSSAYNCSNAVPGTVPRVRAWSLRSSEGGQMAAWVTLG